MKSLAQLLMIASAVVAFMTDSLQGSQFPRENPGDGKVTPEEITPLNAWQKINELEAEIDAAAAKNVAERAKLAEAFKNADKATQKRILENLLAQAKAARNNADPAKQQLINEKIQELLKNIPPDQLRAIEELDKAFAAEMARQRLSSKPVPPDVQILVDGFKKADPQAQKDIIKKLDDMAKNATTADKRQAAEDASKICNGDCDNTAGQGGQPKPGADKADGEGDAKTPGRGQNPAAPKAGGKQPGDGQAKTDPQGQPKAKPGDQGQKGGEGQAGRDGKPADQGAPGDGGEKPSDQPQQDGGKSGEKRVPTGRRTGDAGDSPDATGGPAPAPNEEYLRKSGDLQLEQFKNKVDKRVLDEVKMTDQEYQEFLRAYADLVKRSKDHAKPEAGDRARGAARGGSAANAAARKVDPGSKTGPKTERGGRGVPPPEFREQYKEASEEQSKQKPAGSR